MSIELIKKRIAKKKNRLNEEFLKHQKEKELNQLKEDVRTQLLGIITEKNKKEVNLGLSDIKNTLSRHNSRFSEQIEMINELNNRITKEVSKIKTIKGEKGDTPKKGKDYFTPQEVSEFKTAVLNLVLSLLPPQITKEDIFGLVKPLIEKDKTEYDKKWQELESRFKEIPDLKTLEKLIENIASNYVKKNQGYTGGGANFFFELDDTPKKQSKFGNPYKGQGGKVVKVKSDEKGLEFGETGSGNPAGDDKQIQFNDGGAFGADADLTWDKVNKVLNLIGRLLLNKASYPEIDLFDGDFSGDGAGGTNDGVEIAIDTSNGWGLGAGALVLVSYYKNIGFINLDGDAGVLFDFKDGAGIGTLDFSDLTADRIFTFPNLAGTIALTSDLDDYIPYNDANQDILPTDDTVSLGSLISEKRFKHLHISGVKVESEFTSSGEASAFGFNLSAVIGQTIGVTDQESNGVLTFGRTTSGNVQHTGSRVWLPTLNPVFYSIQKFNSITDNQHIWGLMTTGTDISDIQGIYFAKLTGEANIQARVRDGAGTQTTDTGVAVADATMQEFLIQVTNGRARFYINGTEVADISSNVPTEHLRWVWRIETSGAGTKTFGLDYAKIYQNRN